MKKCFFTIVFLFFTITIFSQQSLYTPSLLLPANGSKNLSALVTLSWKKVQGAYTYKVQVDTDTIIGYKNVYKVKDSMYVAKYLAYGRKYYWRVKAFDISGNDSSAWSATFSFGVVKTVTLTSPPNLSNSEDIPVTIGWNTIAGSIEYNYEIDITPYFNSPNFKSTTIPKNSVSLAYLQYYVNNGTTYYWRVRAIDSLFTSAWSTVWNFTISFGLNQAVQLSLPPDSSINVPPSNIKFKWEETQNASWYTFQIDTSPKFNNPVIKDSIVTLQFSYPPSKVYPTRFHYSNLNYGQTYYWRVRAVMINKHGTSDSLFSSWSNTWVFNIIPHPYPVKPINGAVNESPANLYLRWGAMTASKFECWIDTTKAFNSKKYLQKNISIKGSVDSVTFSGLLNNMTYYWQVRAIDSSANFFSASAWSPTFSFNTNIIHIPAPVLLTPANNAINQALTPTFTWSAAPGATYYKIQIDTDISFSKMSKPLLYQTASTIFKDTIRLKFNKTYYWEVKTFSSTDSSFWTNPISFTTVDSINALPDKPNLYMPLNGAINRMPNAQLVWQQVLGASGYIVKIDDSKLFNNPVLISTDTVQVNASDLKFGVKYYWKVIILNNSMNVDSSVVDSFTVIKKPILISPVNNAIIRPLNDTINQTVPSISVKWNKITGIISYVCKLDVNKNFDSPNLIADTLKNTNDTVNTFNTLQFNTTYYWQVIAITDNDISRSDTFKFVTAITLKITNPLEGSVNPTQVQLVFTPLAGATEYDYRIVTDTSLFKYAFPDSTYGLTYSQIDNLLFGKTYYIEVRGRNSTNTSPWSLPVEFSTIDTVNLISPVNGSIHQMPNLKLEWDNILGVSQYDYELDINNTFTSQNIIIGSTVDDIVSPGILKFGVKYYWRVKAQDFSGAQSKFNSPRSFTIIDTVIPKPPTITKYPATNTQDITFNWQPVTGITSYQLEYDTISNLTTPNVLQPLIQDSSFKVKALKLGVNYYWRIRALQTKVIIVVINGISTKETIITDSTQWGYQTINEVKNLFGDNLSFDVYPVPSKDELFIKYSNPLHVDYIILTISNVLGQKLYSERLTLNSNSITKAINVSYLSNGIYFLRINYNNYQAVRKIVIR